ncbi:MAG: hypothetical protein JG781_1415 [Peptococcaceae bacterium]|jgi:hypothetical protein|nr:hypothetical protein [Peptococcaceae bacterium]
MPQALDACVFFFSDSTVFRGVCPLLKSSLNIHNCFKVNSKLSGKINLVQILRGELCGIVNQN